MHYLVTLVLLFIFFRIGVLGEVLHKLALSQWEIHYGMLMMILLSLVNVRLFSFRAEPAPSSKRADRIYVGINLGGCILPLFYGLYLSRGQGLDLFPLLTLSALVALVVYPLSRISGRRGLVVHLFGAIVVAAIGGVMLGGEHYLVWAYLAAVLGTLIGGDLLHLAQLARLQEVLKRGIFIGGAGLMDAIFLSGLFAMLTAEVVQQHHLLSVLS